ncbi:Two-component response regulator ORR24 [Zea mays]|uniref:Two-component response regulator ORR24 n=2 Tax=Zea mays TaxID=4577 RepID=A0A3L6EMG9_MAIZE|nr:Two-component response regulator ORR24 [Zea mays]
MSSLQSNLPFTSPSSSPLSLTSLLLLLGSSPYPTHTLLPQPHLSLSACVLLVLLSLSSPALTSPPFPAVSWISRIQTTALVSLPSCLLPAYVQEGPCLGDPGAWFLGSAASAAVGFAEPEPPEMTVDELKLQARASGGHGAKDQFPVGMRVLAVDDDPTCLKILENLLLRCQYHVTTTGQAATALKLLREKKDQFDLVISDVHMPDMDGFKLLELVGLEMDLPLQQANDLKILALLEKSLWNEYILYVLSANGETQTVMKGITHGACDYLLKPVRIEQLRTIWQHVVRRRSCDAKNSGNDNDDSGKKLQVVSAEGDNGGVNRNKRISRKEAVPKKILDLMNVENITRENVASHLQKYRLYLKRLSADASRQANLTAAFGGRNPAYVNMGLDAFRQYNAYGRYRPVPTTNHSQPNNLLARMNSPAFGMHGLLPSQPLQIGHNQNNLSTSLGNVGGMNNGNLIRGAHMPLQDTSKCFPTGPSGNSFANISNSTQLVTTNNLPLQSLEPSNQQHLGRLHSSADPFNSFVGEPPQFADLGRCNTTWPTAVSSSNVQEIGQKDRIVNRPKLEPLSSFTEASSQIPLLGNEMQSHQVASLASNGLPMPFTQEAVPFAYGSSTNSREMLNNNLALSNSGVNSTLPNLRIDGSVVPGQTLGGSNSGGCVVPPLQDGRIDHQAVSSHLNYNNELMGTGRLQRGLSGGLDDIVVDMFRPDRADDGVSFIDGDWELV